MSGLLMSGVGASCSIKWEGLSLSITRYNIVILIFVYLIPVTIMITINLNSYFVILKRRRRASINLNAPHTLRQYLIERRITFTVILIIAAAFVRAFGTIPSLFAKTSGIWNPLIYVAHNRNIRHYLRFCTSPHSRRDRTSDPTRFLTYPLITFQLPLVSTPNSR
ncbi:unnamed protein product [Rotaria socialis]|uniref:G-protein coupled receptors family 1 profile domain-containing protein n=1 Tax=Rotaria socialis TaxID=392032 RepID=A0A821GLF5_9BILA|nr:unnamed protein product [Rotaria socialis]